MTNNQTGGEVELPELPEKYYLGGDEIFGDVVMGFTTDQMLEYARKAIAAQTAQAVPVGMTNLDDWDRISEAAKTACKQYGQWMPERWVQLFVAAYNKEQ